MKLKTNKNDIFKFALYGDKDVKLEESCSNFLPINYDDYITVCVDGNYKYWDEVVELVAPVLHSKKIGIVVFSVNDAATYSNCLNINKIKFRHALGLMERAICHFSGQDWSLSFAQSKKNIKYSFFKSKSAQTLISGDKNELNDDKPETLAFEIFKRLNLKNEISVSTQFIGPSYGVKVLEIIPDFDFLQKPNVTADTMIGVRCDLVENWPFVLSLVQSGISPFVTCKSLPPKPIRGFLTGVKLINLYVGLNTDVEAISDVESLGVSLKLLTENENAIEEKRKFFDCSDLRYVENWGNKNIDKLSVLNYDTKIKSKRVILSKDGIYLSVYHWLNKKSIADTSGHLLMEGPENEAFLKEADLFYYYN